MLAAVIIAAVVGPAVLGFGPRVAGMAERTPIPGPPVVGDCLLAPPVAAGSALTSLGIAIAAAPYAACPAPGDSGRAFGEIVSVTPDVREFPTTGVSRQPVPDPEACDGALRDYLDWPAGPWEPVILDPLTMVGPDAGQYAVGQRWIACALTGWGQGYTGSVRDGFGRAADRYGQCEGSTASSQIPCSEPHTTEVFGVAMVDAGGRSDLADSCATLVAARTGMADPTAGGQLVVRAGSFDPRVAPSDDGAGRQATTCAVRVAGGRMLDASLAGIGDRPLPWS